MIHFIIVLKEQFGYTEVLWGYEKNISDVLAISPVFSNDNKSPESIMFPGLFHA